MLWTARVCSSRIVNDNKKNPPKFLKSIPKKVELSARIELATPSLPRKYSTTEPRERIFLSFNWLGMAPFKKWSGRRDSNSRHPPWKGGALPTELRPQNKQIKKWWRGVDSNHRKLTLADLQSAPFGHSGTTPVPISLSHLRAFIKKWSCSQESNLRPTVYKTVALPAELEQLLNQR